MITIQIHWMFSITIVWTTIVFKTRFSDLHWVTIVYLFMQADYGAKLV